MRTGRDRDAARDRSRERRRRGNRKYGQAKLRHARKGIISCIMAVIVFGIFAALIVTAFLHKGQSAAIIGSLGLFAAVLAGVGCSVGFKGFRERDKNYLTCRIGVGVNGFLLLCFAAVFVRGIM